MTPKTLEELRKEWVSAINSFKLPDIGIRSTDYILALESEIERLNKLMQSHQDPENPSDKEGNNGKLMRTRKEEHER